MADIVFFDLEFTAWEGSVDRDWSGDNEWREVVQIGAVRCDGKSFEPNADPFMTYVMPQFNPVLSDFFIHLTGITNEDIQSQGINFSTAANLFHQYSEGARLASFGNDAGVMNENRAFYALENDIPPFHGFNLRPWLRDQGFDLKAQYKGERLCSGNLAAFVGAEDDTVPHNAVGDALSVRKAIAHLVHTKNHISPFTHE